MVIDGFVIYKTYHDNNQDYFNCKLNWKAKNSLGKWIPGFNILFFIFLFDFT